MKNYYQQKRGGWTLEPEIYAKTVGEIRCYPLFRSALGGEGGDFPTIPDSQQQAAKRYIQAVEQALEKYVPGAYREAVMDHMTRGVEYSALEESRFISASTLKRYVQVFVWGVAEELGENLRRAAG